MRYSKMLQLPMELPLCIKTNQKPVMGLNMYIIVVMKPLPYTWIIPVSNYCP